MKIVVTAKVIHDDGSTYQETLLTLQKTAEQGEPLGLSLNESKILLNSTQLAIIQTQSQSYMQAHRECPHCHQRRQIKIIRPAIIILYLASFRLKGFGFTAVAVRQIIQNQ